MAARFDHLVVAVEDLDEAAARWRAAGIPAERGGAHPVGTENVLVRGPAPAYVELIAAGSGESNPWLDRIRSARGPISWAVAVDDLDDTLARLREHGAQLVDEVVQYEDVYRLCYVRGPEGILIGLAEQIG